MEFGEQHPLTVLALAEQNYHLKKMAHQIRDTIERETEQLKLLMSLEERITWLETNLGVSVTPVSLGSAPITKMPMDTSGGGGTHPSTFSPEGDFIPGDSTTPS